MNMAKTLRKLAEEHALVFWILCVLFYVVGYKVFRVMILEKTPYTYDVAFFRISLAFLAIIMMKEIYNGKFSFNLHTSRMMKGVLLLWPGLLFLLINLGGGSIRNQAIVGETLLMVIISNMATGFYEEIIMRGMLLKHMMQHWRGDQHRILKSVVVTSVLFGVVHLGNLVYGQVAVTLTQVVYATALGLLFAAAYLRTANLWSCVLVHGIVDISGELHKIYYRPGEEIEIYNNGWMILIPLVVVICLITAWYEFRKKKRLEILALWEDKEESL